MAATHNFGYSSKKIMVALGSVSALIYSYLRLGEINQILGTDIIISAEKQLRNELDAEKTSEFLKLENSLEIYQKLIKTYFNRFIYFETYKQASQELLNKVVRPVINNYEQEGILQNSQVIQNIRKSNTFNNKLTEEMMRINQENTKIKQINIRVIQRILSLQNQLMTLNIIGLSKNEKDKIDMLYNYIRDRNITLAKLINHKHNIDFEQWSVQYSDDYLSKIQLL